MGSLLAGSRKSRSRSSVPARTASGVTFHRCASSRRCSACTAGIDGSSRRDGMAWPEMTRLWHGRTYRGQAFGPKLFGGDTTHMSGLPETRNKSFDLTHVPRHWLGGRGSVSLFFDTLPVFFPAGERFFVRSVRAHERYVKNPELLAAARAFSG